MTFGSSRTGTGMDNSNPEVRDQERNGKNPFPKFGNGKGIKKTFPKFGNGKGMRKIHSHNSETGIRGYHSREYPGTGMEKKQNKTI